MCIVSPVTSSLPRKGRNPQASFHMSQASFPLRVLRHHVSGAIARGQGQAIAGQPCPSTLTPFRVAIAANVRACIKDARKAGTVGMSLDCLKQCTRATRPPLDTVID